MTHTRGPWRLVPSSQQGDWIETASLDEEGGPLLTPCPGSGGAMSYSTKIGSVHWSGTPQWDANARLIVAACNSYDRHCGERAVECAEADLLGQLIDAARNLYDACEYRANQEGGDFGPDIGPAAETLDLVLARVQKEQP